MTPEEKRHIYVSKHMVSCLPCLMLGWPNRHADYHHVIDGNERYGHLVGFPMCLWHHRGMLDEFNTMTEAECIERMGPSFELHRKKFIAHFGSEEQLVARNNFAVDLHGKTPWEEHAMPPHILYAIQHYTPNLI